MDRALCGGGPAWARRPEPCASTCPHMLSTSMTELLVAERVAHPFWDGRKLLTVLQTKHRRVRDWTAPSTVARRLARHGLAQRRRVRQPTTHPGVISAVANAPNMFFVDRQFQRLVPDGQSRELLLAHRRRFRLTVPADVSWIALHHVRTGQADLRAHVSQYGGNRQRVVGDLLPNGPAGHAGRTRSHHSDLTHV